MMNILNNKVKILACIICIIFIILFSLATLSIIVCMDLIDEVNNKEKVIIEQKADINELIYNNAKYKSSYDEYYELYRSCINNESEDFNG